MSEKGKTILILGNGFDLAHGLPTRYSDFLEFCQRVTTIWAYDTTSTDKMVAARYGTMWIEGWNADDTIKKSIIEAFASRKKEFDGYGALKIVLDNAELSEIHDCLKDNVWYDYLLELYKKHCMKGENWIDFESEIRFIIKTVDENTSF